jgi:hypothetical protein
MDMQEDKSPSTASGAMSSSSSSSHNNNNNNNNNNINNQQHLQNLRIMAEWQKQSHQHPQQHPFPPHRLTASSSSTVSYSHQQPINDESFSSLTSHSSAPIFSSSSKEPIRGVKKTSSLRRGAAGYNQLLQSAVLASIETSSLNLPAGNNSRGSVPPPSSPSGADNDEMLHTSIGSFDSTHSSSPSRKNKRTRQQQQQTQQTQQQFIQPLRHASLPSSFDSTSTPTSTSTTMGVSSVSRKYSGSSSKQRPRDDDDDYEDDIMMLL